MQSGSMSNKEEYYRMEVDEVLVKLDSSLQGLPELIIPELQERHGPNRLEEKKRTSKLSLFIQQFKDLLIMILIVAAFISFVVGDLSDSFLIIAIIIGNALLGFVQEYKAEQSLESLKQFLSLRTVVIRDGNKQEVLAEELVPGDILELEAGDSVPADARIISSENLLIDESMLTGESLPVEKEFSSIKEEKVLAEQGNMLFMGTNVVKGWSTAIVVRTGMDTEIGSIAKMIEKSEETYFQKKLDNLAKFLAKSVIIIAAVVFALGVIENEPLVDMILISLSLAVAAIPEGLPAVVTISLSLGVRSMAKINSIVKRLPAAETLGSCDVICSDKTGTITKNKMTIRHLYHLGNEVHVDNMTIEDANNRMILEIGTQCNTASLDKKVGDPTELALLEISDKHGITKKCLHLKVLPFDSERKRMSVFCPYGDSYVMYCKGATEQVISICDRILVNGQVREINDDDIKTILAKNDEFSSRALRVLGFCFRYVEDFNSMEEKMIFAGMQAMIDPPKEGVREAIEKCKNAGIKVVMITGDHALTAKAIATEVGIYEEGDLELTGRDLEGMSDDDLSKVVEDVSVYARVDPIHKLKIIEALRNRGHVISMTGDGVNDAPALKSADIGVAMNSGTDVSKESSDMILLDDNFTTIVNAVEEGRHIFDNIRKFVRYLLSTNFGEVFTIFLASLIGFPLPLVAVQILWINLLTDGLPALSLAFERKERNIMQLPPHKANVNIVDRKMTLNILYTGTIMAVGTLYLYSVADPAKRMTFAFTTLVLFQLFNVFNCRSLADSIFQKGQNLYLIGAVAVSLILQLCVIYIGPISKVFYTVALDLSDWAMIVATASIILVFEEARKLIHRINF